MALKSFKSVDKADGAGRASGGEPPPDALTLLAIRMKKGDRKAAAKLYDTLLPKTYGFFLVRTGERETAEDLSQDIFLKLVEKADSFDEARGRFAVWFWRMAHNMLIDHYRAKRETPFSAMEETAVEELAVDRAPDMDARLRCQAIRKFLKGLSEDEQELFEMRYVAELPYGDIAEVMDKSEGALRVAALRIKQKIKEAFNDDEPSL